MSRDIIAEAKKGWQKPVFELDEGAIMAAVRAEAAVRPVRRVAAWRLPNWLGGVAAGLALAATLGGLAQSLGSTQLQLDGALARGGDAAELVQTASLW